MSERQQMTIRTSKATMVKLVPIKNCMLESQYSHKGTMRPHPTLAKPVCRWPLVGNIQTKLRFGQYNYQYEREADKVANQVMSLSEKSLKWKSTLGRDRLSCRDGNDELLRTKPMTHPQPESIKGCKEATHIVQDVLRSSGRPLDSSTRQFMETRYGHDFSEVRVHTNRQAALSAQAVSARAYTVGQNIVFGWGQYNPSRREGLHLLAHELAHVIQQSGNHTSDIFMGRAPFVLHSVQKPRIMRAQIFANTLRICHQYLRSRTFRITRGGLRVTTNALWGPEEEGNPMPVGCRSNRPFSIQLRKVGMILDSPWGVCEFAAGAPSSRQWTNLPTGDYYLGINTPDTGPYCCLNGSIEVFQERNLSGDTCTQPPPGPLETLHDALAVAGMIPALGVIPDAIDAGIYVIQGQWSNAGISAAAMIPIFGQAATIGRIGSRTVIRVQGAAVRRIGRGRIVQGLQDARTAARAAIRAIPQGFTERQFRRFARGARRLRRQANLPDGELVIHGSRVRGTARATSDIDVALRVDDSTFFNLAEQALSRARIGTRLRATMLRRIRRNGQLSSFDLGTEFQRLRRDLLDLESPVPVQFSVLRRGGRLDTGPFLPLN